MRIVATYRGKSHATTADVLDTNPRTLCGRDAANMAASGETVPRCKRCAAKMPVPVEAADETTNAPAPAPVRRAVPAAPSRGAVRVAVPVTHNESVPTSNPLRVYVLSRKSAKEGPDNASEAAQRREGVQWCDAHGHVAVKVDGDNEPASGVTKEVDLPKRAEALRMFRDGEIDVIWVANQSRISREGALKVASLIGEGYRFYVHNRRLDTATLPNPNDDFLGCVQVLFEADADRKLSLAISENVRRSRVLYHDTGAWSGRAPYGTRVVGVKAARRLTNDPATWPVIVRILRDTADGVSRRELARALTAEGIPSPGSYERDTETGRTVVREVKPWALGMITRIVHHPVYEGWLTVREHGRDVVYRHSQTGDRVWAFAEGAEVIPADLAARARQVGSEAADPKMKRKPGKVAHLLTGITFCAGGCGSRMPVSGVSQVCGAKLTAKPCPSPASVGRALVESAVVGAWHARVANLDPADEADQELLVALGERWRAKQDPASEAALLAAKDVLRAAEKNVARLRDDRDAGLWDDDVIEYRARLKRAQADVRDAEARVASLSPETLTVGWESEEIVGAWDAADAEERRALIRLAVREVRVYKASRPGAPWNATERVEITWVDGSVTRPVNG